MTTRAVFVTPDSERVACWTDTGLPRVGDVVTFGAGRGTREYVVTLVRRTYGDVSPEPHADAWLAQFASHSVDERVVFVYLGHP